MDRIQLRRDTSARWAEINPILLEGEVGYEIDTKLRKIGDGVNRWNDLEYLKAEGISQETGNSQNITMSQDAITRELSELGSEVKDVSELCIIDERIIYVNGELYNAGVNFKATDYIYIHGIKELTFYTDSDQKNMYLATYSYDKTFNISLNQQYNNSKVPQKIIFTENDYWIRFSIPKGEHFYILNKITQIFNLTKLIEERIKREADEVENDINTLVDLDKRKVYGGNYSFNDYTDVVAFNEIPWANKYDVTKCIGIIIKVAEVGLINVYRTNTKNSESEFVKSFDVQKGLNILYFDSEITLASKEYISVLSEDDIIYYNNGKGVGIYQGEKYFRGYELSYSLISNDNINDSIDKIIEVDDSIFSVDERIIYVNGKLYDAGTSFHATDYIYIHGLASMEIKFEEVQPNLHITTYSEDYTYNSDLNQDFTTKDEWQKIIFTDNDYWIRFCKSKNKKCRVYLRGAYIAIQNRINSLENVIASNDDNITDIKLSIAKKLGKDNKTIKWQSIGDSFTEINSWSIAPVGSFVRKMIKYGYQDRVCRMIPNLQCDNIGSSGQTFMSYYLYHKDKIKAGYDLYTIMFGTNDYGQKRLLGHTSDFDDDSKTSVIGYFGKLYRHVKSLAPNAKIIVMNTTELGEGINASGLTNSSERVIRSGGHDTSLPNVTEYGVKFTLKQFADAIKDVCESHNIDFVNIHDESGFTTANVLKGAYLQVNGEKIFYPYPDWLMEVERDTELPIYPFDETTMGMTYDGTHPSDLGMEVIATLLAKKITELFYINTAKLYGRLKGKVVDNVGNPLSGVEVQFDDYTKQYTTTTDNSGNYLLENIDSKMGAIFARKEGYKQFGLGNYTPVGKCNLDITMEIQES